MHFVSVKKCVLRVLELSGITNTVIPVLEDERIEEMAERNTLSDSNERTNQMVSCNDKEKRHMSLESIEAQTELNLNQIISNEEHPDPTTAINNNSIPIARPVITRDQRLVHFSIADAVREVLRRHDMHSNEEYKSSAY
jgi:hypothetical protein